VLVFFLLVRLALLLAVPLAVAIKLNILLHYIVGFVGTHVLFTRSFKLSFAPAVFFLAATFTLAGGPALHLVVGDGPAVEHDRDGVAAVRLVGEDVDLGERSWRGHRPIVPEAAPEDRPARSAGAAGSAWAARARGPRPPNCPPP